MLRNRFRTHNLVVPAASGGGQSLNQLFADDAFANGYYADDAFQNPVYTDGGTLPTQAVVNVGLIGDSLTDYNMLANTKYPIGYPTAVTKANPCQITLASHNFVTGDVVYCTNFVGMTQLNGNRYTVTVIDTSNFTLNVDSTAFGTWTGSTGRVFATRNASWANPARGYFNWAGILSGNPFKWYEAAALGVAGETSTNVVNRLSASLLTRLNLNVVILMIGTNDFTNSVSAAAVQANVTTCINYITGTLGAKCILGTVSPRDADTAPQKAQRKIYNDWVRTQGTTNVLIWDYEDQVATARDSFTWKAGYSADGIHPTALGAYYMVYNTLVTLITANYGRPIWQTDGNNILLNSEMAGTGGTASAATFNGNTQVATSYTITSSGTVATYRTLSKGSDGSQICDFSVPSGASNQEGARIGQTVAAASLISGAWYRGEVLLKLASYTGTAPLTELSMYVLGSTGLLTAVLANVSGVPTDPYAVNELVTESGTKYLRYVTQPFFNDPAFTTLEARSFIKFDASTNAFTARIIWGGMQLYSVPDPYI